MKILKKTIITTIAFYAGTLLPIFAETFQVFNTNGGVSGVSSVNADTFSDAKAIFESKNLGYVVYKIERYSGEPRSIEYMSYGAANDLARTKNKR
jgi:hypothetical protein